MAIPIQRFRLMRSRKKKFRTEGSSNIAESADWHHETHLPEGQDREKREAGRSLVQCLPHPPQAKRLQNEPQNGLRAKIMDFADALHGTTHGQLSRGSAQRLRRRGPFHACQGFSEVAG